MDKHGRRRNALTPIDMQMLSQSLSAGDPRTSWRPYALATDGLWPVVDGLAVGQTYAAGMRSRHGRGYHRGRMKTWERERLREYPKLGRATNLIRPEMKKLYAGRPA